MSKVLTAFVATDGLFAAMGAVVLGFSIVVKNTCFDPADTGNETARDLLYQLFPLTAGIGSGVMTLVIFLATLPALVTNSRGLLKFVGYLVVVDSLYKLILGADLWVLTLKLKETLSPVWNSQTPSVQSQLQMTFNCCGYFNSTSPAFVTDSTCPSPASAALMDGCASPINSFGQTFVDMIFTAIFGMVGVNVVFIMAIACLSKERKEMERFRHIDEKGGLNGTF
ncbi:tetraspanin [Xylariomycetidae sp. FL0641]|nr:tetraspanin [Xylariomycetidae sp. FL0641]